MLTFYIKGTVGRVHVRDVSTEGSVWSRLLDTRVTDESVIAFTFEKYDRTLATFPGYDHFLSAYYTLHTLYLCADHPPQR